MAVKPKKTAGAPSKFNDDYCEQVEKLALLGLVDTEMAEFFGVTERTFNNWKSRHPEFFQSLKRGRIVADANVAQSLYHRARGYSHKAVKFFKTSEDKILKEEYDEHYPPDTGACLIWLHNRQRGRWRRNPDPNEGQEDLPPTTVVFEVHDARTRENEET